jgi:HAD superfamily hydrolase (TIGR01450 family)
MIADQYDVFLFDLDGVIYRDDAVLAGSRSCIRKLRALGKKVYFLTNDPRPTRQELCDRLNSMEISVSKEEIITSGWATAQYLAENNILDVFAIATEGFISELKALGIRIKIDVGCQAVVVGYNENTNFAQIQQAIRHLEKGSRFIATNADKSFPGRDGQCIATGAIVEMIRIVSGKQALIIGKPYSYIFSIVLRKIVPDSRMVMICDSLETDILGAHRQGIDAILLSKDKLRFPSKHDYRIPDKIISNLLDLFEPYVEMKNWKNPGFPWPDDVKSGVTAVIFNVQRQVLLVRRNDNGLWSLPSGHLEIGETVTEAIKREIQEETGLIVDVKKLIGVYSDPISQVFSYPSGVTTHFITLSFLCCITGGFMQADYSEIAEVAFFDTSHLPTNILKMHPRWLKDALADQSFSFFR